MIGLGEVLMAAIICGSVCYVFQLWVNFLITQEEIKRNEDLKAYSRLMKQAN